MIEKTVGKEAKRLMNLTKQTYKIFGLSFLLKEVKRYILHGPLEVADYGQNEDETNYILKPYSFEEAAKILKSFVLSPKISIITPVYNILPKYLNACIESVISQCYTNWELCLYDDCSTSEATIQCLKSWVGRDTRIKIAFGNENMHISLASNQAIKMATGEFIALLDHDDELASFALLEVVKSINENPDVGLIYSDEDFISLKGNYYNPHFKSDFNRSLLLSYNYICHFAVVRKELGDDLGWFREGYEGAQDYDLFLRIMEARKKIVHVPKVLYHWRQSATSTSLDFDGKSYANEAAKKALSAYALRNGIKMEVLDGFTVGSYRFKREIITAEKVTIIIPFKDQVHFLKNCVESAIAKTRYENFEILLVSNNSVEEKTFLYLNSVKETDSRIKVLEYNHPFNYSAINNWAVQQSDGAYVLLLNNDTKVISDGWLEAMLEHIQQECVGIVGAKLLYNDNTIQHAGVIVGLGGVAGHSHRFCSDSSFGYFGRPSVVQELSAVTGACLLTKRSLWNRVGGLDEKYFKIAFNDIDFCLKIRKLGYDVVYTPYVKLYHYESKSRGPEDTPEKQKRFISECNIMVKRWGTNRIPDPFYNVNLTLSSENFGIRKR
jgi:GT2 family glycosyltransferase